MAVGPSYIETMGLKLAEGRTFTENRQGDHEKVLVTSYFAEFFEMEKSVIGNVFKIEDQRYQIIGVLEDFHFYNFYYEQEPTIITLAEPEDYQYLAFQVSPGEETAAFETLQSTWIRLFPEAPLDAGYQDLIWTGFYRELIVQKHFTTAVAIILVILSCLGLYGLIRLNLAGRVREFSIRKVLGADFQNISKSILRQYVPLAAVAIVLGSPLSHILIKANLDMMYPDPRPFGYSGVTIAVVILIFILLAVIATQIRRVINANPVEGLKIE
ncbi:MAG: FtsX-like permease family protein [Bacteroidota bacterium]